MPIFEKDPPGVGEIINRMIERYHGGLRDAGLTIDVLEARAKTDGNGDSEAVALKLHGYPCAATIKISSYKDRVLGRGDALLTVDGDQWDTFTDEQKEALIDHELEHLELRTDNDGLLIRDDMDRPKLQMRRHDHQFGWFDAIVRRHGDASLESQQLKQFTEKRRQLWLPFESIEDAALASRNNQKFKTPEVLGEAEAQQELPESNAESVAEVEKPRTRDRDRTQLAGESATKGARGQRGVAARRTAAAV